MDLNNCFLFLYLLQVRFIISNTYNYGINRSMTSQTLGIRFHLGRILLTVWATLKQTLINKILYVKSISFTQIFFFFAELNDLLLVLNLFFLLFAELRVKILQLNIKKYLYQPSLQIESLYSHWKALFPLRLWKRHVGTVYIIKYNFWLFFVHLIKSCLIHKNFTQ